MFSLGSSCIIKKYSWNDFKCHSSKHLVHINSFSKQPCEIKTIIGPIFWWENQDTGNVVMRQLYVALGWELPTRNSKPWLEASNFWLYTPPSPEGRGPGEWVNRSCLCDEVSIKIPVVWGAESFCFEHIHIPGEWCLPSPQGQKLLHLGPSQILPCVSLHLAVQLSPLSCPLIRW